VEDGRQYLMMEISKMRLEVEMTARKIERFQRQLDALDNLPDGEAGRK
jgi:hypothetical protein